MKSSSIAPMKRRKTPERAEMLNSVAGPDALVRYIIRYSFKYYDRQRRQE